MAKRRIKLLHNSNHPKATGTTGQIIECDADIAQRFIEGKGAIDSGEPVRTRSVPRSKKKPSASVSDI